MTRLLLTFTLALSLTGCSLFHIHRMDVEQGNVITDQDVSHLHKGMKKEAVVDIMGTPALINTFRDSQVDYVYSYHEANGPTRERYVTLRFNRDVLTQIEGNSVAEYVKP